MKENSPQRKGHSSEVWPCGRKYITVRAVFEVSFAQASLSADVSRLSVS